MSVSKKKKSSPVIVQEEIVPSETVQMVETVVVTEKKEEPSVSEQLKRISEHLVFLEKKLDTLLEQSKNQRPLQGGFAKQQYYGGRDNYRPAGHGGYHSKFGGGQPKFGGQNRDRFHGNFQGPRQPHNPNGHFQKKYHNPHPHTSHYSPAGQ